MRTSNEIALAYINYAAGGHLSGVTSEERDDAIVIWQEIENEESSKYVVVKNEVSSEVLEQLREALLPTAQ